METREEEKLKLMANELKGELAHTIPILQDGAAAIILDENGRILLQSRADRNKWGLPGGMSRSE